ncbi:MAG TPA: hypothetical protein VI112_06965, partial [Bacteroidia bacterium]
MKRLLLLLHFLLPCLLYAGQFNQTELKDLDPLNRILGLHHNDTVEVRTLKEIGYIYSRENSDTAIIILDRAADISRQLNYPFGIAL